MWSLFGNRKTRAPSPSPADPEDDELLSRALHGRMRTLFRYWKTLCWNEPIVMY